MNTRFDGARLITKHTTTTHNNNNNNIKESYEIPYN